MANNAATYQPTVGTENAFVDAWGIPIRPAGNPRRFWVLAGNKPYECVFDVTGKVTPPCAAASALHVDLAPLLSNTTSPSPNCRWKRSSSTWCFIASWQRRRSRHFIASA